MTYLDYAGRQAGFLALVEVGLGSLLHSLHLPFAGHFLSLNQGFILCRSSLKKEFRFESRPIALLISIVACALKSLSPAGKKLTPMLAILCQGIFFSVGTFLFGANALGLSVGMLLLCLWGFLQPFLLYYFLYGNSLFDAGQLLLGSVGKHTGITPRSLLFFFLALVAAKLVLGLLTVVAAYRLSEKKEAGLRNYLRDVAPLKRSRPATQNPFLLAARDLFNPLFCLSLGVALVFFLYSESSYVSVFWRILRPIALGFILFFLVRWLPIETLFSPTSKLGYCLKVATKTLRGGFGNTH